MCPKQEHSQRDRPQGAEPHLTKSMNPCGQLWAAKLRTIQQSLSKPPVIRLVSYLSFWLKWTVRLPDLVRVISSILLFSAYAAGLTGLSFSDCSEKDSVLQKKGVSPDPTIFSELQKRKKTTSPSAVQWPTPHPKPQNHYQHSNKTSRKIAQRLRVPHGYIENPHHFELVLRNLQQKTSQKLKHAAALRSLISIARVLQMGSEDLWTLLISSVVNKFFTAQKDFPFPKKYQLDFFTRKFTLQKPFQFFRKFCKTDQKLWGFTPKFTKFQSPHFLPLKSRDQAYRFSADFCLIYYLS